MAEWGLVAEQPSSSRRKSRCPATFFGIAGCYRCYHCPLSRRVFLGKPTPNFVEAEKAVLEGMEAGRLK